MTNNSAIQSFVPLTTSEVTSMAHLLFKIYLENIFPRVGTRSNFSDQDVVVVAMFFSGKKFDLTDLILRNMLDVLSAKNGTGLAYRLLLIKIFQWYGVELRDKDCVPSTKVFDLRSFTQSNLKLIKMMF